MKNYPACKKLTYVQPQIDVQYCIPTILFHSLVSSKCLSFRIEVCRIILQIPGISFLDGERSGSVVECLTRD